MNRIIRKGIELLLPLTILLGEKKSQSILYSFLRKKGINIFGEPTFISVDVYIDGTDYNLITIEDKVVISREVTLLTHDFAISRAILKCEGKLEKEKKVVQGIHIGKNCFIGARTLILPGTFIGDNTIVGAGSVIKGNIPSNVVVAGNPCRIICSIDDYYRKQITKNSLYIKE